MIRKIFFCVFVSIITSSMFAQSAVVTAGGTANGSGGSATYTVGQIADQRVEGSGKYIIEGVQQPYEIQTVGIDNYPNITLNAVVYPNPTIDKVVLSISNFDIPSSGLTMQLFDFNGKQSHVIPLLIFCICRNGTLASFAETISHRNNLVFTDYCNGISFHLFKEF